MKLTLEPGVPTYVLSKPDPVDHSLAQHDDLAEHMRACGARVYDVPIVPGKPDSVFIKDSAVLVARDRRLLAFAANPTYRPREEEQPHRIAELKELGFEIAGEARKNFEAGDFVMLPGDLGALMGYGIRSELESHAQLEEFLHRRVVPLKLTHEDFFHLDLTLSVMDDGTLFVCKEGLSDEGWKALNALDCFKDIVLVGRDEAYDFALNWVAINGKIILGRKVPRLMADLERRGYEPILTTLDQFHRYNGGAACLVNKIHRL